MANLYYIPDGPANLTQLFDVNFDDIEQYYLEIFNHETSVIATTSINDIVRCSDEIARIHFVNYLGTIDCIEFSVSESKHIPKSESYKSSITYPLIKSRHAANRFNVSANDTITAITCDYGEAAAAWIDELFDSPLAWIEKDLVGQGKQYLPIVIVDSERQKVKQEDRYIYEVSIVFTMSHDRLIIRN